MKRYWIMLGLGIILGAGVGTVSSGLRSNDSPSANQTPTTAPTKSRQGTLTSSGQTFALAEKASSLSPGEWPAFFEDHREAPAQSRLLAGLWRETDPAGFWNWLRAQKDRLLFEEFGPELVTAWAREDPDAAFEAVGAITDKALADNLRRKVIDEVLLSDVEKGVSFAARSGDFNRFGWGEREWMKDDPEAAVRALATLPPISKYRKYLQYTLPIWAAKDADACLEWLRDNPPNLSTRWQNWEKEWVREGFRAVGETTPEKAAEAALQLGDAEHRDLALGGVLSSGALSPETQLALFNEISLPTLSEVSREVLDSRDEESLADLQASDQLLRELPTGESILYEIEDLASKWQRIAPDSAWDWAKSLPDPAMRRAAVVGLSRQDRLSSAQVAQLPLSDLSDELFSNLFREMPAEEKRAWTEELPGWHRYWAQEVLER